MYMFLRFTPLRGMRHHRHDQVGDNRVHDFPECRANDNANGQIQCVSLVHELLEFLEHAGLRMRRVRARRR